MNKIINTLKYGDAKTKLVLIFSFLTGIASVVLFIMTFVLGQMLLFFCGILGVFITISLAQTLGIYAEERPLNIPLEYADKIKTKKQSKNKIDFDKINDELDEEYQAIEQEKKNLVPERPVRDYNEYKEEPDMAVDYVEPYDESGDEVFSEDSKDNKKKAKHKKKAKIKKEKVKNKKRDRNQQEITEENMQEYQEDYTEYSGEEEQYTEEDFLDDMSVLLGDYPDDEQATDDEEQQIIEDIHPTEEVIKSYDKKKIKKTLHKYKVRKDHRMVLIDFCDKYNIRQTPAYIWAEDSKFHILLIEKEPRYITLPLYNISQITYLKKQPANPEEDYKFLQGNSIMAELFKPYLPDYLHSNVVEDLTSYKNLYGVGPGLYFTNQSARHLFDLLSAEFIVDDKVTTSTKVNHYFKDSYKANIMLRDSVIDANGYADKISNILENMAMSTISYNEFKDTLNLMIKNKLITQEFATYYMDVRDKNSR